MKNGRKDELMSTVGIRKNSLNKKGFNLIEVVVAMVLLAGPALLVPTTIAKVGQQLKIIRFKQSIFQIEDEIRVKAMLRVATYLSDASRLSPPCVINLPTFSLNGITLQNDLELALLDRATVATLQGIDLVDPQDLEYSSAIARCDAARTIYRTSHQNGTIADPITNFSAKSGIYFCGLIRQTGGGSGGAGSVAETHPALVEFLYLSHDLRTGLPVTCSGLNPASRTAISELYYTIHMRSFTNSTESRATQHYSNKFISANPLGA